MQLTATLSAAAMKILATLSLAAFAFAVSLRSRLGPMTARSPSTRVQAASRCRPRPWRPATRAQGGHGYRPRPQDPGRARLALPSRELSLGLFPPQDEPIPRDTLEHGHQDRIRFSRLRRDPRLGCPRPRVGAGGPRKGRGGARHRRTHRRDRRWRHRRGDRHRQRHPRASTPARASAATSSASGGPPTPTANEVRVGTVLPSDGVTYYEVPAEYGVSDYRYNHRQRASRAGGAGQPPHRRDRRLAAVPGICR